MPSPPRRKPTKTDPATPAESAGDRCSYRGEIIQNAIDDNALLRIAYDGCLRDIRPTRWVTLRDGTGVEATQIGGTTRSTASPGTRQFYLKRIDDVRTHATGDGPPLPLLRAPAIADIMYMAPQPGNAISGQITLTVRAEDAAERDWWSTHHDARCPLRTNKIYLNRNGPAAIATVLRAAITRQFAISVGCRRHRAALRTFFTMIGITPASHPARIPISRWHNTVPTAPELRSHELAPHAIAATPPLVHDAAALADMIFEAYDEAVAQHADAVVAQWRQHQRHSSHRHTSAFDLDRAIRGDDGRDSHPYQATPLPFPDALILALSPSGPWALDFESSNGWGKVFETDTHTRVVMAWRADVIGALEDALPTPVFLDILDGAERYPSTNRGL